MRTLKNHTGFTLVELAVVLVIIGLLVGLGSSMVGPMTNFVRVRETRDMEDANLQAIVSWASSRNMLPNAGSTETGFKTVAKSPQDAWGQDFLYLYDGNFSPTLPALPTKDTICGRRSTAMKLALDATTTLNNVAFAVFSRADNTAFQSTKVSDGAVPVSGAIADTIQTYTTGKNPDVVRWVTLDELRSKIGCQGAPLKIVNNELPSGKAASGYSAALTADGGVPAIEWCVETPTSNPFTDSALFSPNACNDPTNSTWLPDPLTISKTLSNTAGSYKLIVYVRDSSHGAATRTKCDAANLNYNCAQKTFVITVNSQ